jgi:hypothetical protein
MQQMMIEANWYGEYGAKHIPQCNTVTASMVKVVANAHQLPADERLLTRVRVGFILPSTAYTPGELDVDHLLC